MYDRAIEQVEQWIYEAWPDRPANARVDIYTWPDVKDYGLRVAELSLSNGQSGSSFMQSDAECSNVLFLIERAILDIVHFADDSDLDYAKSSIISQIFKCATG
jgi:hypothetical protein